MGQQAKLRGVFTAMVTPFKEDDVWEVDYEGYLSNLERQLRAGIIPVVLGTTGEAPQVNRDERTELVKLTIAEARNYNLPVVVGVTSESYRETMHNAEEAKREGAHFILATPTPYNRPQQHDIVMMYKNLNKLEIPFIVYNIESRTGRATNIQTKTLREIAQLEYAAGVKEASGNLEQMKEVIDIIVAERPDFSVVSGDDNLTFPLLGLGGDGIVSVVTNLVPEMVADMVNSYLKGDKERAEALDKKLRPLYEAAFIEGNPKSIKELMSLAGLPSGRTRPSLYYLKPETVERLREVLSIYELVPVK